MHDSSINAMFHVVGLIKEYAPLDVVDIGSMDVNGCYRPLFKDHRYTGYDIAPGPNVDITGKLYQFPFKSGQFDVAVSGQTIEHVADIHTWIKEIARIVKKEGLVVVIGPHTFHEHRFPIDCWRILPDGMNFLLKEIAGLEVIKIWKTTIDTVGIGRKI